MGNRDPPKGRRYDIDGQTIEEWHSTVNDLLSKGYSKTQAYYSIMRRWNIKSRSTIYYHLEPDVRDRQLSARRNQPHYINKSAYNASQRDRMYLYRNFPDLVQKAFEGESSLTAAELSGKLISVLNDMGRPHLSYVQKGTIDRLNLEHYSNTGQYLLRETDNFYKLLGRDKP